MKKNKEIRKFILAVLVSLQFLFVNSIFAQEDQNTKKDELYPQKELKICISEGIPMLHPHVSFNADEAQILTALYEGLFTYDPYTLQAIPALAEKWTVTGDRTWRFTIRKDAKFQNGDPITAETIYDSWFNLIDPNAGHQYASLLDCIDGVADYRTGKLKNKNDVGIKLESEHELLVYTNSPAAHLPNILCHHAFSAVHKSQLENASKLKNVSEFTEADKAFKPIASGAYKIEEFTNDKLVLSKNESYWDNNTTKIPKITMFLNLPKDEAAEKFNLGEIDWLARADVLSKICEQRYIHIDPIFATEFFFFKTGSGIVKNEKFRKALLLAIPYKELRAGYYIKASTLIFPLAGYPKLEGIDEYNIYKAKELIKSLNLKDEEKEIIIKIPTAQYYKDLVEILSTAWEKLGIKCIIKEFPFSTYYDELKEKDFSLGVISWIGDFADPLSFLEMFRPNSTLNDSNWDNAEFEQKLKKANAEKKIKKRYEKLAQAEKILLDNSVIIPLSHNTSVNVLDEFSLGGWFTNAIDIHPFKAMYFMKPKPLPGVVRR